MRLSFLTKRVLKDRHSEFAGDLGSFMTAEVKAAVKGFPIGTEQF
jgi:hypothetical protein